MAKKQTNKQILEDKLYGLDVIERYAGTIADKIRGLEKDLHYLHEWIRVTRQDNVTVMAIKSYKRKL